MKHAQQTSFTQLISKQKDQAKEDSRTESVGEQAVITPTDINHCEICYTFRFVRVIPINRHVPQQIKVVGTIWFSQHRHLNTAPQYGRREMSRFYNKAVNIILEFFVVSITKIGNSRTCFVSRPATVSTVLNLFIEKRPSLLYC